VRLSGCRKTLSESFDRLRVCPETIEGTNGDRIEIAEKVPFMLISSKHSSYFVSTPLGPSEKIFSPAIEIVCAVVLE
jgi:hypothetical protein